MAHPPGTTGATNPVEHKVPKKLHGTCASKQLPGIGERLHASLICKIVEVGAWWCLGTEPL